jgi:hypothetical protein
VTDWPVVWLGVIAVSIAVMTAVQIGLIVIVLRLSRQLSATAADLQREVRPLIDKALRVADETAKAVSLAAIQVERVDQAFSATVARVDQATTIVRNAMGGPVRQSYAAILAIRAILSALRPPERRERAPRDEEDALFVG